MDQSVLADSGKSEVPADSETKKGEAKSDNSTDIPTNKTDPNTESTDNGKVRESMESDDIEMPECSKTGKPTQFEPIVDEVASILSDSVFSTTTDMADIQFSIDNYFFDKRVVELARHSWPIEKSEHYLQGCYWSPDGTCILTAVHGDGMHVFEMPLDLYSAETVTNGRPLDVLTSAVHVPESGTVYDYCWYPLMSSSQPELCCWIATRQHEPIQMWDAFTGQLRGSYRGYNSVDEIESAISVIFTPNGSKVIGGYKKSIKIFDTKTPGRDYTELPVKSPVSCLAVNESDENQLAIGSWKTTFLIHDLRTGEIDEESQIQQHSGGITAMKFSPNGQWLVTGARKDNQLFLWDLRKMSDPIYKFQRNVDTNQKIHFDLSTNGQWLLSGDTNGIVRLWNLNELIDDCSENDSKEFQFSVHNDCCNGISVHPTRPIFVTSSGQSHFDDNVATALETSVVERKKENSLIIWWYGVCDLNDNEIEITY